MLLLGLLQVTKTLSEVVRQQASTILTVLAYAGSGNVLHVQSLLAVVGEHLEAGEGEAWKVGQSQGVATCVPRGAHRL